MHSSSPCAVHEKIIAAMENNNTYHVKKESVFEARLDTYITYVRWRGVRVGWHFRAMVVSVSACAIKL